MPDGGCGDFEPLGGLNFHTAGGDRVPIKALSCREAYGYSEQERAGLLLIMTGGQEQQS
jgi:hypothetical protein